jgi:hypothetical protein
LKNEKKKVERFPVNSYPERLFKRIEEEKEEEGKCCSI